MSEEQGFTVKDRRMFSEDGSTRAEEPPEAQEKPQAQAADEPQEAPRRPSAQELPPVDFSGLILSLSHAAVLHLGLIPDQSGAPGQAEPALARHTIDTIALLRDKTKGNLTEDEQKLIDNVLTELRLAYVQVTR